MRFRKMAEYMSEEELELVFKILFPHGKMVEFERRKKLNYICVKYICEKEEKMCTADLLPDDVYLNGGIIGKEEPYENGENLYRYRQFMVSRGYSEMWSDNYFDK